MSDKPKTLKGFLGHAPSWVYRDPAFKNTNPSQRFLLTLMAGAGDKTGGDTFGIRVGSDLIEKHGGSPRTIRSHINTFLKLGYIVLTKTGGRRRGDVGIANTYAMPAARGSLDHMKVEQDPRFKTKPKRKNLHGSNVKNLHGKNQDLPSKNSSPTVQELPPYPEKSAPSYTPLSCLSETAGAVSPASESPAPQKTDEKNTPPETDPLRDALSECHSWQYRKFGKATKKQREEIETTRQALESMGATPEQVRERHEWMRRNDGRLGLRALVQFWEYAGECIADGIEPGSRRSHAAEGEWNPAREPAEVLG